MAQSIHVERALFMIGDQNTGKSVQLRSIFRDWRFGTRGSVPTARNLPNHYPISNERWLYLRLTSPHEAGETLKEFLDKCTYEMQPRGALSRRWNFAGALQPTRSERLSVAPDVVDGFIRRFAPEGDRVTILHPDYCGNYMSTTAHEGLTAAFRALAGVEVMTTDARARTENGLIYADFFDFT